jgi:hypothetical protein
MADEIAMIGGVDTHTDLHQVAVIDGIGRHLATEAFETTPDGYQRYWTGCTRTASSWRWAWRAPVPTASNSHAS